MFENYTDSDLKVWLTKNKVLFVTNSICLPGSVFLSSMRTYIDKIPVHNFYIIPGLVDDKPYYGVQAFFTMLANCYRNQHPVSHFDYIIYIDEDCFITDFKAMIEEFYLFMKDDRYCLAGPQDGGVLCHRNHRHNLINTFISFWNVKLLKESCTLKEFNAMCNRFAYMENGYAEWIDYMDKSQELKSVLAEMNKSADTMLDISESFRRAKFGDKKESPYADVVRNDESNEVEQHQIPYSYEDLFGRKHKGNFEPYYLIEEALIALTKKPVMYMFSADYYSPDKSNEETDNSGLTSEVMYLAKKGEKTEFRSFALHTWFARAYSKWPYMTVQRVHTNRINKIIFEAGAI